MFGAMISAFGTALPIPRHGIARRRLFDRSILHLSASHDDHVIVIVRIRGRAVSKIILDRSTKKTMERHDSIS